MHNPELDAYADAGSPTQGRPKVEHMELLTDADLERFVTLGVCASMRQAAPGESAPRPARPLVSGSWPWRPEGVSHQGSVVGGSSTWIGVGLAGRLIRPGVGMASARLRRPPGLVDECPIWCRAQMTGEEALDGYTRSAALMAGDPSSGSVWVQRQPGRHAFRRRPGLHIRRRSSPTTRPAHCGCRGHHHTVHPR